MLLAAFAYNVINLHTLRESLAWKAAPMQLRIATSRIRAVRLVLLLVAGLGFSSAALATTYTITAVLEGENSGGFQASFLHDATRADTRAGAKLAFLEAVLAGTFEIDTNGVGSLVGATFSTTDDDVISIDGGGFEFASNDMQTTTVNLIVGLSDALGAGGEYAAGDYDVVFTPGSQCCSGAGPNSLRAGPNGTLILTLWGAGPMVGADPGGPLLGVDIQLELTAVPLPAALVLFGSGLLGLVTMRRRRPGRLLAHLNRLLTRFAQQCRILTIRELSDLWRSR